MSNVSRRNFLFLAGSTAFAPRWAFGGADMGAWSHPFSEAARLERHRVLNAADRYLKEQPRTITSVPAPRSAGGLHDFYSEGDYWWPDPKNPSGAYIRRDGKSNPSNFTAHRELMIRLSIQMPALTAAWVLTKQRAYAEHAIVHLRAWFVDPATRMNPNLEYAQAIHGRNTGRSIGIIDTVHLVEVAQAALVLERAGMLAGSNRRGTRLWFAQYVNWLTQSKRGHQERDEKNNHGSCWILQVAGFATYTGNDTLRSYCRHRLETVIFPGQIAPDGSFPLELARTKPYSYSLFNLDILGMSACVLSSTDDDLWTCKLPDGRGLEACFRFMVRYIRDKKSWPYRQDVEYYNDLPVRQPSLIFAGLAYRKSGYLSLWEHLKPDSVVPEIIRNHPIRQPILWMRKTDSALDTPTSRWGSLNNGHLRAIPASLPAGNPSRRTSGPEAVSRRL